MKKLFLIVILFLFMPDVLAVSSTYYGEYSEYFTSSDEILESDTTLVEEYKEYQYYKQIEKDLGYNYHMGDDYIVDYDDYIFTEFSDYYYEYPIIEDYDHQIISRFYYEHYRMMPFKHLIFNNISGSYGALRIPEIEIFANGKKVDYEVICDPCTNFFDSIVKNGNKKEYLNTVYNGGELKIELDDYYYFNELEIRVYLYDISDNIKTYDMYMSPDGSIESAYLKYNFANDFKYNNLDEITFIEKLEEDYVYYNPMFEDSILKDNNFVLFPNKLEQVTKYKYRKYLYRHYENELKVCDEVSEECVFKSEDYETFYKYKVRDKLTIKENIEISSKDDIPDYIVYSSSKVEYEIIGDKIKFTVGTLEVEIPYTYIKQESEKYDNKGINIAKTKVSDNSNHKSKNDKRKFQMNIGIKKAEEMSPITKFPLFMFSSLLYVGKKINDSIH